MMQGNAKGHVFSVDCLPNLIIRVILTASENKKWYISTTLLLLYNSLFGAGVEKNNKN
jgi:hypothetical protein